MSNDLDLGTSRVVVLGSEGCGKTSMIDILTGSKFSQTYLPTRVNEFGISDEHKLSFWGAAAIEEQSTPVWATESYFRPSMNSDVTVVILAYDLTNKKSFDEVRQYYDIARQYIDPSNVEYILVGTKDDLSKSAEITDDEIARLPEVVKKNHMKISAKTKQGYDELLGKIKDIFAPGMDKTQRIESNVEKKEIAAPAISVLDLGLLSYRTKRGENHQNYYRPFARFFGGYSKNQKIAAVDALQDALAKKTQGFDKKHLGALKQGNLGKLIRESGIDLNKYVNKEEAQKSDYSI